MDELPGPAPVEERDEGFEDLVAMAAEGDGDIVGRLGPPGDRGQDRLLEGAGRRGLLARANEATISAWGPRAARTFRSSAGPSAAARLSAGGRTTVFSSILSAGCGRRRP